MAEHDSLVTSYAEFYLQLMRTLDRRMAEQGASFARTKFLLCLEKKGTLRAIDMADLFSLSPRTVTEAIDGLERDGLVERTPDPNDRRAKLIQITAKGLEACARTEPLRDRIIAQTFGTLDAAERKALGAILEKMAHGLARDPA